LGNSAFHKPKRAFFPARGSFYGATLSSFLLEFDAKGFCFFDAAVQLFKQGRHLRWDARPHRTR
jgi:hypothetical protein